MLAVGPNVVRVQSEQGGDSLGHRHCCDARTPGRRDPLRPDTGDGEKADRHGRDRDGRGRHRGRLVHSRRRLCRGRGHRGQGHQGGAGPGRHPAEGARAHRPGNQCDEAGHYRRGHAGRLSRQGDGGGHGRGQSDVVRDGIRAAHQPRPGDGRPVLPGQSGRLSRGDRGGLRLWQGLSDDDDGGGHGRPGQMLHHGRRRRRAAGHRHRAAAGRGGHGHRRAPRDQGAGRKPGRNSSPSRTRSSGTPRPPAAMPSRCRPNTRPNRRS